MQCEKWNDLDCLLGYCVEYTNMQISTSIK